MKQNVITGNLFVMTLYLMLFCEKDLSFKPEKQ